MRSNVGFKLFLAAAALIGVVAVGCSESGPTGVYADIQWQVRCQVMGMCTPSASRSILGFDQDPSFQRVSCNVVETASSRILSFNTRSSDGGVPFGLVMTNATFPSSGGSPAAGCQISVTEGSNTYVGACGGSPPSMTQPCQVTNVTFGVDPTEDSRSLIRGEIYCVGVSPNASPNIDRELTAPGGTAGMEPLIFSFYDCDGFNPGS